MLFVLLFSSCSGTRPSDLGATQGQFRDCPDSPNCVSTQTNKEKAQIDAIPFEGEWKDAKVKLLKVLADYPRTKVITDNEQYLHVEFKSRIFRFVDDVEFYFNELQKQIDFRSASRLGHSDLGANRKRMDKVRDLFLP